jgi:hypothetical protein
MKFFAVAATFIAAVAANTYPVSECVVTTVTVTETMPYVSHTPSAPGSAAPTIPPYPTSEAPYPTTVVYPTGGYPSGTGAPAPSGTGAYNPPPADYTGAASSLNIGGFVAGVGAFAALLL